MPAMSQTAYPRRTFLPPAGRPRWQSDDPAAGELLYLSWGYRCFGDHPLPTAMHDGWVCWVLLEGSPGLVLGGRSRRVKAPAVFIFHPDCAYGWTDRPGHRCEQLTWLWRSPPAASVLRPPPGGHLALRVEESVLRRVRAAHAACRQAVAFPSELGVLSLLRSRLDLDIALAESLERRAAPDPAYRYQLAAAFLRNHLAERDPVRQVCEYLQVSPATLKNLFHQYSGSSPLVFVLRERMRRARLRLLAGASVKEVAHELGYRHPNDLSRAFKRFHGTTSRDLRSVDAAESD